MKTYTINTETHKVVPIKPANALQMGFSYIDAAREDCPDSRWQFSHAGYRAMIAAAPEYPADPVLKNPMAWYLPDVKMVTTSEIERDRWMSDGHIVISLYPI